MTSSQLPTSPISTVSADRSDSSLPTGAIVGIAVGVILAIGATTVLTIGLVYIVLITVLRPCKVKKQFLAQIHKKSCRVEDINFIQKLVDFFKNACSDHVTSLNTKL